MAESMNWQSSVMENRVAWVVASLCLLLIAIAAFKPDLFEFSSEPEITAQNKPVQEEKQQVQKTKNPATAVVHEEPKPAVIDAKAPVKSAAIDVKKAVEKTAPITEPSPTRSSAQTATGYYVQLGAFSKRLGAQGQVDQLKQFGWDAVVFRKKGGLFAVWAGPKAKRADAESLQQSIQRKLKSKGFIVYHKSS